MKDAYSHPGFCDVAYDWDRRPECDFIERCIERYSDAKGRSILDIACGTGIHLMEFARRGYEVAGIDAKKEMVDFVLKKAAAECLKVECSQADMKRFEMGRRFGCAACMLDSFRYLLTDDDIFSHLRSVAACLEDGGLYVIDLWMPGDDRIGGWEDVCWTQARGNIRVDARYIQHGGTFNPGEKTFDDELIFKVTGPSVNSTVVSRAKTRALLFPEFRELAGKEGSFELKEKFYNFDFKSKEEYNIRSIRTNLVLKKRR
ncbi:MAG: class I SAM-dependent methyltransferase [Candidatus Omnitrophica bacterium]|nr:class I SAM-dependent methyltransferase [Candidatus Omnitrophota bacterium]